jgi:tetratricopeptide (TPR) repeat protein
MHDLVRLYAVEQAHAHTAGGDRRAALHRVLDHHVHTAYAAALLLNPHRDPIGLDPPQRGVTVEDVTDYDRAVAWFTTEHAVLVSAVDHAVQGGFDNHVVRLAETLATFLDRWGHWPDRAATQSAALDAARRLSDRPAQAHAHRGLARAHTQLGRHDAATAHLGSALELFAELGDHTGQANTHLEVARTLERRGRYQEALDHTRQALDHYRRAGKRSGQADALNGVGWLSVQLGDYRQALTSCQQALSLHQEVGHRHGEANTWDSLGYAHHHLGQHQQAIDCYDRAVDLHRYLGDRYHEADSLGKLGDTHQAAGNLDRARHAQRRAQAILDRLGPADANRPGG